uniref:Gag-pol polyprotein n=1 Tax=Solanum tuberosum TaxID=4113 RepID=M1D9Y6_SOLTU
MNMIWGMDLDDDVGVLGGIDICGSFGVVSWNRRSTRRFAFWCTSPPSCTSLQHRRALGHWVTWYCFTKLLGDALTAPYSADLILSFRAQHTGTKVEVTPFDDSPSGLSDPQAYISSFLSAFSFLFATYAPNVVATMEVRVHRYVDRLDSYLVRDCTIASLNKDIDIARMQTFAQKLEDQKQRRRAQETERGHQMKDCPKRRMGDIAQPTGSAVASSSSMPHLGRGQQVPTGRGRGVRGAASSSGVQYHTYALGSRQNLEASPDVVTGTLFIFSHNVYALIDPGSTLSYITPLVVGKLKRTPKLLNKPFEVSTPTGESIIARRVYRNCIVTVCDHDTLADLIELEMVDFEVITDMDWLASCYAMVDCQTKRVHFQFPNEAVLE